MNKQYLGRISIIIITILIVSQIIYFFGLAFFSSARLKNNKELIIEQYDDIDVEIDNRIYYIVLDKTDKKSVYYADNFEHNLNTLKVKYRVYDINDKITADENDIIILTVRNWTDNNKNINKILDFVENGSSLFVPEILRNDSLFLSHRDVLGIIEIGDNKADSTYTFKDDILIGVERDKPHTSIYYLDNLHDIQITDSAKVYIEDSKKNPRYYTVKHGLGTIGVYNGLMLGERWNNGFIIGFLGTLDKDFVYPIIGGKVLFMDDWPAPYNLTDQKIMNQYGMNYNDFLKYIWWPDLISLIQRYDIKFTTTLLLEYNAIQEPPFDSAESVLNSKMYVHYQQILKRNGEICMHGYNHFPFYYKEYKEKSNIEAYKPWKSKEYAVESLKYAVDSFHAAFPQYDLNCYVPPSNITCETGIEIVKEALGTPVIISSLYTTDSLDQVDFDFCVKDDVLYFPRFTSGSKFTEGNILGIASGVTSHGVISHYIHPDDLIDIERSNNLSWAEMIDEYKKMFSYFEDNYSFIENRTITECGNLMADWYGSEYTVSYNNNYIIIEHTSKRDEYPMILKTEKEIKSGNGYTFEKIGNMTYSIKLNKEKVIINLKEKN